MFDFLSMVGNYEDRKIDRYEGDGLVIDTAMVTDSEQPYETAVAHLDYNSGKWVIVEMYSSKEDAQEGHDKWVEKMIHADLPKQLVDVSTCTIAQMLPEDFMIFPRKAEGAAVD